MATVSALRVVRAEGEAFARGHRVGLELGDLVQRSLAFYRDHFERQGLGRDELEAVLAPYRAAAEQRLPDCVAWLDGMAEAAQVPAVELFAINTYEELEPRSERCSTFVVSGEGATLLGHNEMWLAGDAGNVAVVVEQPSRGTAVASATVACCLPAVGMNAHGVAQGVDSLTARNGRPGVPRVLVSRHALEAADRADALRRAALPGRAGGYAHVFAFAGDGSAVIETTAEHESLLEPWSGVHTNHYLDQELALLADPPSRGSADRYERLRRLLDELRPATPEAAMEVLRLEAEGSVSNGTPENEDWPVVFSVVCDVDAGRMWVAPGDPSATAYNEIDLDGVV